MYIHEKEYDIKYSDVDCYDRLKLSALLGMMQESACLSADELKFGYKDIRDKDVAFVVTNWCIRLNRPITVDDKIIIKTWPIKPKHLLVFRDFEIYIGCEKVGAASSRWCLVDLKTFSMRPASVVFADDWREYNDFRSIDGISWKIPEMENGEPIYSKVVAYSDYDHYNHVNNTRYADFAFDVFSVPELKDLYFSDVQIAYVKQCKFGEKIDFYREFKDGAFYVDGRVGNELRVQFKIGFEKIEN